MIPSALKPAAWTLLLILSLECFLQVSALSTAAPRTIGTPHDVVPKNGGKGRPVLVNLVAQSIANIDAAEQTFVIDVYLQLYLQMELSEIQNTSELKSTLNGTKQIGYTPTDDFASSFDVEFKYSVDNSVVFGPTYAVAAELDVDGDGYDAYIVDPALIWVLIGTRYAVTLRNQFDLKAYPFDEQILNISIEFVSQTSEEYFLVPRAGSIFGPRVMIQSGFDLDTVSQIEETVYYPAFAQNYSRYTANLLLTRKNKVTFGFRIISTIIITTILTFLLWAFPLTETSRHGNAAAFFLAVLAYYFTVSTSVPDLPYTTRMDTFVLCSLLHNLCCFTWFLGAYWSAKKVYEAKRNTPNPRVTERAEALQQLRAFRRQWNRYYHDKAQIKLDAEVGDSGDKADALDPGNEVEMEEFDEVYSAVLWPVVVKDYFVFCLLLGLYIMFCCVTLSVDVEYWVPFLVYLLIAGLIVLGILLSTAWQRDRITKLIDGSSDSTSSGESNLAVSVKELVLKPQDRWAHMKGGSALDTSGSNEKKSLRLVSKIGVDKDGHRHAQVMLWIEEQVNALVLVPENLVIDLKGAGKVADLDLEVSQSKLSTGALHLKVARSEGSTVCALPECDHSLVVGVVGLPGQLDIHTPLLKEANCVLAAAQRWFLEPVPSKESQGSEYILHRALGGVLAVTGFPNTRVKSEPRVAELVISEDINADAEEQRFMFDVVVSPVSQAQAPAEAAPQPAPAPARRESGLGAVTSSEPIADATPNPSP